MAASRIAVPIAIGEDAESVAQRILEMFDEEIAKWASPEGRRILEEFDRAVIHEGQLDLDGNEHTGSGSEAAA